jgi:hypothetical protein
MRNFKLDPPPVAEDLEGIDGPDGDSDIPGYVLNSDRLD